MRVGVRIVLVPVERLVAGRAAGEHALQMLQEVVFAGMIETISHRCVVIDSILAQIACFLDQAEFDGCCW